MDDEADRPALRRRDHLASHPMATTAAVHIAVRVRTDSTLYAMSARQTALGGPEVRPNALPRDPAVDPSCDDPLGGLSAALMHSLAVPGGVACRVRRALGCGRAGSCGRKSSHNDNQRSEVL